MKLINYKIDMIKFSGWRMKWNKTKRLENMDVGKLTQNYDTKKKLKEQCLVYIVIDIYVHIYSIFLLFIT